MKANRICALCLMMMLLFISGCSYDFSKILGSSAGSSEAELIKVDIHFTDGESIESYIKDLGIEQDAVVYVGGSSLNYLYDKQGNIVGSYNYQRVLYIKIIPELNVKTE